MQEHSTSPSKRDGSFPVMASMDYSNTCRLCLSKQGRLVPIFEPKDDDLEPLNARLFSHLAIEVSLYDDLPKQICLRCECQVNVWHFFRAECEVSQRKLKRWNRISSTSSLQREYNLDGCEQEVNEIKREPEDVEDVFVEQHSNHSDYATPTEEIERESHQNYHSDGHVDDESHSFNLIITGTASIPPESASNLNREGSVEVSSSIKNTSRFQDCDTDSNDVMFVGAQSQTPSVVEINLENSNDGLPSASSGQECNNLSDQDFRPVDQPGVSRGAQSSLEQSVSCVDGAFKIKLEPEECGSHNQNDVCATQNSFPGPVSPLGSTQVSSDSSALTVQKPVKRKSIKVLSLSSKSKTTNFSKQCLDSTVPVYNLNCVDLPKISNDMFDENSKYCKICSKSYTNLWRHLKDTHLNVDPFSCGGCDKTFPGRRELVTHRVRTISKSCRAGKKPDIDSSTIICRPRVGRGKMGRYECAICSEKFSQISTAEAHVRVHTGEMPFFCYKCNEKEFRLRKTAYNHVLVCTGKMDNSAVASEKKRQVVPSLVSKVLKRRVVKPNQSKDKMFKCKKCGKVFTNGVGYANHIRVECIRRCFACSKNVPSKTFFKHYRRCLKSPESQTSGNAPDMSINSQSNPTPSVESVIDTVNSIKKEHDVSDDKTGVEETKIRKNAKITKLVDMSLKELYRQQRGEDGEYNLKCKVCQSVLGSKKTLHGHLSKHSSKVYKCQICSLRICLRSTYETHMSKVHGGVVKSEDSNSAGFYSSRTISSNLLAKPKLVVKFSGFKMSKLKCDICFKLFSSASSLNFHKLIHKRIKCEKCEISFPATMEKTHVCIPKVKKEVAQVAGDDQVSVLPERRVVQYTCLLCKKKFHTRKMLYQHKKMHIKMKIYKCKMCENSYSDAEALMKHKEEAHAAELDSLANVEEVKPLAPEVKVDLQQVNDSGSANLKDSQWQCHVCSRKFWKGWSYRRHMLMHRASGKPSAVQKPQNPGVLYCSLCDKAFKSYSSFIRHKGWHSRQATVAAAEESKSAVKTEEDTTLEDGANSVSSQDVEPIVPPPPTFDCDVCLKSFSTLKNLKIHMFHHTKQKPTPQKDSKETPIPLSSSPLPSMPMLHKCEICAKSFPDLSSFSSHMNSHLSGSDASSAQEPAKSESMQCKLCNREYKSKKSLKYHMMGHSGEKPYKCRSCSNQYSNPNALAKHEKERHTPVLRPFCCNKCKTSFILKQDLLAHLEKCTH